MVNDPTYKDLKLFKWLIRDSIYVYRDFIKDSLTAQKIKYCYPLKIIRTYITDLEHTKIESFALQV